ncbi:hypothetical protein M0805_005173 [Coniferiporia weirii]|nr:hypothetical protein M0805_005173 [Coniferiporia weirii]
MATPLTPIPQPPTVPLLANSTLVDIELPLRSFLLLASQYGEILQLVYPGGVSVVHFNSHALVRQASDDTRFRKALARPLREVRNLAGDGLFTAEHDEPNWGVAHRILMPAFGAANVRTMFDGMKDICDQMLLKWARFGPEHIFDPSEDYTRLTFDTIALCSMSYRFNSFYERDMPKFTQEMVEFLAESNRRAYRPGFMKMLPLWYRSADDKYAAEVRDMTELAREIIKRRRSQPSEERDLLSLMLEGKDPKTGQSLPEENIIYNLLTFLIAGHETTSGMLTFATYHLLKNPDTLRKLRSELDAILGSPAHLREVTLSDLSTLPYLTAIMRETLRLHPTAPTRAVAPLEDNTIVVGGDGDPLNPANKKYELKKDQVVAVHVFTMMRDPRVWGEDAEAFRPERMLDGKFEALPPQAWQPFGYGMRACIGRPFAWQEAALVLASVFARFDVFLADPSYTLHLKQALTIKPKDMLVRVVPRGGGKGAGAGAVSVERPLAGEGRGVASSGKSTDADADVKSGHPLYVLYGSNTGTSEAFAQRIASDAHQHGFTSHLSTLDSAAARLPTDGPIIIVTASFEGEPADNAAQFVAWLSALPSDHADALKGTAYAVFGCGSREWARTYQRVPALIDERLAAAGAERLLTRGAADVATADFFQLFDEYEAELWVALEKRYGVSGSPADGPKDALSIEVAAPGTSRAKLLRQMDAALGEVLENRLLTKLGVGVKRHIEIALPEGMTYRAGDYLAILPSNPEETVQRALARFGLTDDREITIKASGPTTLPVNTPTSAHSILSGFVELSQPATTRDLQALKAAASENTTITALDSLLSNYQEVLAKRIAVLDLLEAYADISLPLAAFLSMLPPMRIRQYSISSSPLAHPTHVSLTVSVLDAPALSSTSSSSSSSRRFRGVASSFLSSLTPGTRAPIVVRTAGSSFHLPADPLVPLVMFAAGSGLAPFRGFVQERAAQRAAGRTVGRAVLFFGCRARGEDYLYADGELGEWVREGVVDVRPAFSREEGEAEGCRYVQDRVWYDRELMKELYRENAKFFTCGSRKVANGVKQVCIDIIKEDNPGWSAEQAEEAFGKLQKERYATDVFD